MRSLRSFLLEEAMLHESKIKVPEEYKKFETRGPLSGQIKDLLQISISKDMNLDNKNLKCNSTKGQKQIRDDLGLQNTKDFREMFKRISKAEKLKHVFVGRFSLEEFDGREGIILKFKSGWQKIGGTPVSTLKFIRFWCTCSCIAVGIPRKEAESLQYFIDTSSNNAILVVK